MRSFVASLWLLFATAVSADTPMTAAEFEDYVLGRTLYFAADGEAYGVEEYLPGRRVRWSFLDGQCKDGLWYESAGLICFVYEDDGAPQCWSFFRSGTGISARFMNDPEQTELYEVENSDEPMLCLGPDVGV